jgi:hypothetical protein
MRFMVMVRAGERSEAGELPRTEEFEAMLAFNQQLAEAGVLRSGEGLHPSSRDAARITFRGEERIVTDGPFAETKELIAGFWIIEVDSVEEAIDWMRRCPDPATGPETTIEIRRIYAAEDFGEAFTPELQEKERQVMEAAAAAEKG